MAKILIIEKDETVRELLLHQVNHLGHEPVVVSSGLELFGIIFDAVLIEPETPGALELARAFRATRPTMPVICASIASQTPEWKALAPDDYLVKPFPISRLREALEKALAPR